MKEGMEMDMTGKSPDQHALDPDKKADVDRH